MGYEWDVQIVPAMGILKPLLNKWDLEGWEIWRTEACVAHVQPTTEGGIIDPNLPKASAQWMVAVIMRRPRKES